MLASAVLSSRNISTPASLSPHNHSNSTLCYRLFPPTGCACLGPRARGRVVILTVMPSRHYSVGNRRQASSCLQSDKWESSRWQIPSKDPLNGVLYAIRYTLSVILARNMGDVVCIPWIWINTGMHTTIPASLTILEQCNPTGWKKIRKVPMTSFLQLQIQISIIVKHVVPKDFLIFSSRD